MSWFFLTRFLFISIRFSVFINQGGPFFDGVFIEIALSLFKACEVVVVFGDLAHFWEILTMPYFSNKEPDLGLDDSMADFYIEESWRSQFEKGIVLEEDLSLGFGPLRAIIFFLIMRYWLLECTRGKRIREGKR